MKVLLTTFALTTASTRAAVEALPLSVIDLTRLDLDVGLGGDGSGSLGDTAGVAVAGKSGDGSQQRHQAELEELHLKELFMYTRGGKRMNVVVGLRLKE